MRKLRTAWSQESVCSRKSVMPIKNDNGKTTKPTTICLIVTKVALQIPSEFLMERHWYRKGVHYGNSAMNLVVKLQKRFTKQSSAVVSYNNITQYLCITCRLPGRRLLLKTSLCDAKSESDPGKQGLANWWWSLWLFRISLISILCVNKSNPGVNGNHNHLFSNTDNR